MEQPKQPVQQPQVLPTLPLQPAHVAAPMMQVPAMQTPPQVQPIVVKPVLPPVTEVVQSIKSGEPNGRAFFITAGFALIVFAAIFIAAIISNGTLFGTGVADASPTPMIEAPLNYGLDAGDAAIVAIRTETGKYPTKDQVSVAPNFITIGKKIIDILGKISYVPGTQPGKATDAGTAYCYGANEATGRFVFGVYNNDTRGDGIDYSVHSDKTITCTTIQPTT